MTAHSTLLRSFQGEGVSLEWNVGWQINTKLNSGRYCRRSKTGPFVKQIETGDTLKKEASADHMKRRAFFGKAGIGSAALAVAGMGTSAMAHEHDHEPMTGPPPARRSALARGKRRHRSIAFPIIRTELATNTNSFLQRSESELAARSISSSQGFITSSSMVTGPNRRM